MVILEIIAFETHLPISLHVIFLLFSITIGQNVNSLRRMATFLFISLSRILRLNYLKTQKYTLLYIATWNEIC